MPAAAPLVSVCVPTYNYGRFIGTCIESVLRQSLSDWELVIVDDSSSDDTVAIVERYAGRDSRIGLIRNETRLGMNPNLKKAADSGRGVYLKILCSDDWLTEDSLATLAALLENHPSAVVATGAEVHTDERGNPLFVQFRWGRATSFVAGERMLDRMALGHGFGGNSSFMLRAAAYHAVGGYDAAVRYAADYDLAARLCQIGDYIHTDHPVFFGRWHPAASSATDPAAFRDIEDWFGVPDRVLRPRPIGSRNWFRWQIRSGELVDRYLLNALFEFARGRKITSRRFLREALSRATPAALVTLPFHIGRRVVAKAKRVIRS